MEESIYKHNYEYLSIEEAKAIVNGTFVQGTTNIGGELATKGDIGKLLDTVNKKLTSIVPSTEFDNEFICFFECEDIETFPDDLKHRWIEVSPIQFTFPADGGSVKITGSYGLTGTLGTRKKVGDIADTITADANATPSTKSGSKTYYYNNDQSQTPTAKVSWTQPGRAEEFPKEWTYVFQYNISDTNGGSSTGTSWSRQYYANGQEIKHADDLTLNGITSYRTKTGTFGTVKKENVQYSGQIGRPSGYNYSDKVITQNGRLVQQGSNKQLQWSYTQEANVKVWGISADPTSLHFEAAGGTQSVSVTTWYTWQYNNNNNQKFDQNTTTENITAEANTLQQQKTWTKVITKNNKSVSIQCTQEGAQEQFPDDLQHRWVRVQPESSQISVDGGTINVTGSYGLTGTYGTEKKVGDITDTITVERNSTQSPKSGSKTYHYNNNQTDNPTAKITWTQPGRAEEFPDDEAHRWIEITPTNAGNFTEAGGTITVTGSYGLTGSFGTKKTVGHINDTITVEKNTTTQTKSGSKTYYYNNTPGTAPSATVTWTQDARAIITPTGVHVTNIILHVGQNQKIQYEVTPSNADVDTCTYEVTSGSNYVHITDGVVYADAAGKADCKITINGTIESTFQVSVTNNNIIDLDCDVIAIQNCGIEVGLYAMSHYLDSGTTNVLSWHGDAFVDKCEIYGRDGYWSLVNFDKLRQFYESIKNEQSQVKGKTVEQMCQSPYGPAIEIIFYDTLNQSESQEVQQDEKRTYKILRLTKNTPSASIYYNDRDYKVHISGYDFKESASFSSMVHAANNYTLVDYYLSNRTIVAENYFFVEEDKWSTTNLVVPKDGEYISKGYQTFPIDPIKPVVDAELLNKNVNGATISGQIKINSINGKTDISTINGYLSFEYRRKNLPGYTKVYGDSENGLYNLTRIKNLPYTFNFKITRNNYASGLFVNPIYIDTADKELIKVHDFNVGLNTNSIVGEIK